MGKLTVIAGDRFNLFQQVKQEFVVTPETTVVRFDDLVCGLRMWVKVLVALILVVILWLVIQGRRVFQQAPVMDAPPPPTPPMSGLRPPAPRT